MMWILVSFILASVVALAIALWFIAQELQMISSSILHICIQIYSMSAQMGNLDEEDLKKLAAARKKMEGIK